MFEFHRQHPIATVTQFFAVIKQNIVPIIIFIVAGSRNINEHFWVYITLGLVSSLIIGILSWYRFTFRVHEDELQIKKGIFLRKKLYLKKDRIQVIDITEGIIQRVFGLVKVEIKTAGGGTEKASLSAISKKEAVELRSILRNYEPGLKEDLIIKPKQAHVHRLNWKLSNRNLFYAALTSGNFGVIASILGVLSGQLDQFITDENIEYITSILPGYSQFSTFVWGLGIILFISYILSFIGVILRYGDFRIEKKDHELLITSGLIERKQITVPFDRIQAFRFVEGILRQPFAYGMLYVENAGFEQKESERSIVLLPYVRKNELASFYHTFVDIELNTLQNIVPPKRSIFRYIRRKNYFSMILIPLVWYLLGSAWYVLFLIIPCSIFGWLEYRDAQIQVGEDNIQLQYRVLAKTTALVKRTRTQVSEISINPFQKRKNLASVNLTVASGAGGKTFSVDDLDHNDAELICDWTINHT